MKRKVGTQMLFPSLAAVAGVALGATMALAAHPEVQLYTYEEIALQYGATNGRMPVVISDTAHGSGFPMSTKQSCGTAGCHRKDGIDWDYNKINNNSFHSAEGMNEFKDQGINFGATAQSPGAAYGALATIPKPWVQGGAMMGKWCNPSLRQIPNMRDQQNGDGTITNKTYADAAAFQKAVDLSVWDFAVYCGSCHPGGGFVEKDRNGVRHSMRQSTDIDAYNYTVIEGWTPQGAPNHTVQRAPWAFPAFNGGNPANGAVIAPHGWGQAAMGNGISDNQLMMPNIKEMDCMICHFKGYNNMMSSVMTYSGMLSMANMAGAGIMSTNSMSPYYQGYDPSVVTFRTMSASSGRNTTFAFLNMTTLKNRMQAKPAQQNCRQCHIPTSLTDFPSMMKDFLSSAPMVYKTNNALTSPFTGLEMPAFDFNAPFSQTTPTTSITYMNVMSHMIASIGFPEAMGLTGFNTPSQYFVGGGNPQSTGPLYFENASSTGLKISDAATYKKSIVPFPRSEWFKRGDLWDGPQNDVHYSFECSGCHLDTKTTRIDTFGQYTSASMNEYPVPAPFYAGQAGSGTTGGKSLCDPGRGFDNLSNTESDLTTTGVPYVVTTNVDGRNTVKKCANCHQPEADKKNNDGIALVGTDFDATFGAPDPTAKHALYGLTSNAAGKAVRAWKMDGGSEVEFVGSHLDLIDCSVCHIHKQQTVVRGLDSSSGNRYPGMIGFDRTKGMVGMFTDDLMGKGAPVMEQWMPLFGWQKIGDSLKQINGSDNPNWRRKFYATNMITAQLWYNENTSFDANGDGQNGRPETRMAGFENNSTAKPYANVTWIDAWIQRDLKAGMNFGPSGFAPVPVGFGSGSFMSAYDANGYFTGTWKYVGVYGGNVMFSTPNEVNAYLTHRGTDWDDTKMLYSGVPFRMTHNISRTSNYVLGKSCADCHAPNKGVLDGAYDMIGTAIDARGTGLAGSFMAKDAVEPEIVFPHDKLITAAEVGTRSGSAREVPFQEEGCWVEAGTNGNAGTFTPFGSGSCTTVDAVKVTKLDRFTALYPDNETITNVDGTVMSKAEYKQYLLGIGGAPVAQIATINGTSVPANPVNGLPVQAATIDAPLNQAVTLTASNQLNSNFEYSWTFSDNLGAASGQTISRTFPSATFVTATLHVKNKNTGAIAIDKQTIKVVATPPAGSFTVTPSIVGRTVTLDLAALPAHAKIQVLWGDGNNSSNTYTTSAATYSPKHTYYGSATSFNATVKLIAANGTVAYQRTPIVITVSTDVTAPTVATFTVPATSASLTVAISALTATDNVAVTGYLVNESPVKPLATAAGWSATAPTEIVFTTEGTKKVYAWVKDAANNVSTATIGRTIVVDVP